MSRIIVLFGSFCEPNNRFIRLTPNNHLDFRRKYRGIRLLKNRRMANLRAFYDPIVMGLSDETQCLDL